MVVQKQQCQRVHAQLKIMPSMVRLNGDQSYDFNLGGRIVIGCHSGRTMAEPSAIIRIF